MIRKKNFASSAVGCALLIPLLFLSTGCNSEEVPEPVVPRQKTQEEIDADAAKMSTFDRGGRERSEARQ